MKPSISLYRVQTVPAATPALVGTAGIRHLQAVWLVAGPSNAATCELKDAASDTGDVLLTLAAVAGSSCGIDLSGLGGMTFNTGLYAKPAGTGAILYLWYM